MSRYIDLDKAISIAIQAVVDVVGHGISQVDAVDIAQKLEDASTADAVEVRHGEWIEQRRDYGDYYETEGYKCSICGLELMDNDYNYCPNCGAKMDGERREENEG